MKLGGKVAVVTGAGSGIGAASAVRFAAEGARVICADINEAAAKKTAEAIEKAGGQALEVRADVTSAVDNQALVDQTLAAWNRLDIFYANAGVPQSPLPIESVDEATFDRIMAVNVKGVFLGIRAVVPVMKRQKSGVILVTGSTAGHRPRPGLQVFASMAKGIALELAPHGIRVVTIAPVATETPMLPTFMGKTAVDAADREAFVKTVPMGRLNTPEDLANAALFLASDDAAMVTGTVFEVDGGRCI